MENPNNIRRSLRIPKELNRKLKEMSKDLKISINEIIIRILQKEIK